MKMILQIEYAALPDVDKKASSTFFTAYRHRTLEKALEAVFAKENILPTDGNTITTDKNLSIAFNILQWIGDQERSFSYKSTKDPLVFSTFQSLGKIAHKMVVFKDEKQLEALKSEALNKLNHMSRIYDVTFLTGKLLPSNFKQKSVQLI